MRVYIIGNDGITLCRIARATLNDGEFAVASNEELRARDVARLGFVVSQIREIEEARQKRLEQQPETGPHAMVRQLARIVGVGIETADMLVHEVLSRPMRDRRAVARYAGLTGAPDESGANKGSPEPATQGSAAAWSNSPGVFCCFRRRARWHCGIAPAPLIAVLARARQ
jgi:transposase